MAELQTVNDFFTQESATLEKLKVCETFGVNCGATVRATVRLMSRLQAFLSEKYSVPASEVATTSKAFKRLFVELGIVTSEEVEHYFDYRKESAITEAQRQAEAKADTLKHTPTKAEQDLLNKINEFLTARADDNRTTDDDDKEACVVLLKNAIKCDDNTAYQMINSAQAQLKPISDNPFL